MAQILMKQEELKYLRLLSEKYPSRKSAITEIINLKSYLQLPKGTEHFISDIHGEYEAFYHILNNASGVIREKVNQVFASGWSASECSDLCTLIYYPKEKLKAYEDLGQATPEWYQKVLVDLIELAKYLSSKYPRAKVREALPVEFSYIIDELLHAQPDEDDNQLLYHDKILMTMIETKSGKDFVYALTHLIKRLAVDHLHIVGDIFDRGDHADKIIDMLMKYHSLDIQWGNHDILWMGAAAGSEACIATVIRGNNSYGNMEILESGYGISLRSLYLFAEQAYPDCKTVSEAAQKAISIILFKLEGEIIRRHPEYRMQERLLLEHVDLAARTVRIGENLYAMKKDAELSTVDPANPYRLSKEEAHVMQELRVAFQNSVRLNSHISFLFSKGSVYRCYNQNLLFHGCIPLDADGNFEGVELDGEMYQGKAYLDRADHIVRRAYEDKQESDLDFMWFLWCGKQSPLSGRTFKIFERTLLIDQSAWEEPKNAYFHYCETEQTCNMILREFGLFAKRSHIINGHTPVKVIKGESPVKANGKLIVIDGGFCKAYQEATGIAGYTLIFNSHGMRIKAHSSFDTPEKAIFENKDIDSDSDIFQTESVRLMISDTDAGKEIAVKIADLERLLSAYREGVILPMQEQSPTAF